MVSLVLSFMLFKTIAAKFNTYTNLPSVTIFATGGTIAGLGSSSIIQNNYTAGTLPIETLLNAIPEIRNISTIRAVQFSNIDSKNFNTSLAILLSQQINAVFENRSADGVVITHGTDTLEETALFLELTHNRPQPIVVVGAMRPHSALSADGTYNLLQAISLASSISARNRGVMIAMNDRIGSAFYTTKMDTHVVDAFKAIEQGYIGMFLNTRPLFYYESTQATNKPYFNIMDARNLPEVVILYAYQDMNIKLLDDAVEQGAKGIVIAGEGDGSVDQRWIPQIQYLTYNASVPVVLSTRTGHGYTSNSLGGIAAGNYNPQKAKILLQLVLHCCGANVDKIKRFFGTD